MSTNTSIKYLNFFLGGVLLLGVFFIFVYYPKSINQKKELTKSKLENKALQNQLDEILHKYDSLKAIVAINHSSRIPIDENIPRIDSLTSELNSQISTLKNAIDRDKKNWNFLRDRITKQTDELNALVVTNKDEIVAKTQTLRAINIHAKGVKILSDMYSRPYDNSIQQIRVCFTLENNEFVTKGDKIIYIQIVNPKNQIISVNNTSLELSDLTLNYSEEVTAFYNQKDTDVCTYVNLEKNKTLKGKYLVNIYADFKKIGTTTFEYN